MKILGIDIGYGDVKVTFGGADGSITKQFKFTSSIGITKINPHIRDHRAYMYKDNAFYVGPDALGLPSENLVDITEYKNLEYYAPLFLTHAIKMLGETPDVIVTGLSKSQLEKSGYFQQALKSFRVNDQDFSFERVFVLPQGAGSKMTIDKYGNNFPHPQEDFNGEMTFVGVDIGFNTLDMFHVVNGKASAQLFEGIEKEGVMKIAIEVAKRVKMDHNRDITLREAKEIIDTGVYHLRGVKHPYSDFLKEVKKEYLTNLAKLIESRYGKIIDKCAFISLTGGGSTIFENTSFMRVPKDKNEFYNSIGFYLFGLTKIS